MEMKTRSPAAQEFYDAKIMYAGATHVIEILTNSLSLGKRGFLKELEATGGLL